MTITLTHEEAQQVLDCIVLSDDYRVGNPAYEQMEAFLCARLAQPEPEPPNYVDRRHWKYDPITGEPLLPQREESCAECGKKSSDGWALYCVKCSEREWQGLTDEDLWELVQKTPSFDETVAAVEAKLKQKNA
jgi:hypothetical protein